jgi:hypothetical protein
VRPPLADVAVRGDRLAVLSHRELSLYGDAGRTFDGVVQGCGVAWNAGVFHGDLLFVFQFGSAGLVHPLTDIEEPFSQPRAARRVRRIPRRRTACRLGPALRVRRRARRVRTRTRVH